MKAIIVYYFYTGNTRKIAERLKDILSKKGEVEICQLKPINESNNFFVQAIRAFTGKRAQLPGLNPLRNMDPEDDSRISNGVKLDLSGYDLICLGTPAWAFAPAPAINTFLDKCKNLDGKDAICFTTYASGTGVKRCINAMIERLKQKGAFKTSSFSIQQLKINDTGFVEKMIEETLQKINITPS